MHPASAPQFISGAPELPRRGWSPTFASEAYQATIERARAEGQRMLDTIRRGLAKPISRPATITGSPRAASQASATTSEKALQMPAEGNDRTAGDPPAAAPYGAQGTPGRETFSPPRPVPLAYCKGCGHVWPHGTVNARLIELHHRCARCLNYAWPPETSRAIESLVAAPPPPPLPPAA